MVERGKWLFTFPQPPCVGFGDDAAKGRGVVVLFLNASSKDITWSNPADCWTSEEFSIKSVPHSEFL